MKYKIITPKKFQKKLDKCAKRGLDLQKIKDVIAILAMGWHYHLNTDRTSSPDLMPDAGNAISRVTWVLVWQQDDEELILLLLDTGSHYDLF